MGRAGATRDGAAGAGRRSGPGGKAGRRWGRYVLTAGAAAVLAVGGYGAVTVARAVATLPPLGDPVAASPQSSVIYDINGNYAATVPGSGARLPVPIALVPTQLQDAFIAVEDRHFYQDHGISIRGILRAAYMDLRGGPLQGGSTITQQLAKNLYLSTRDTLTRKVKEAILALELAHKYGKPQILDMYLNDIYLGEHSYGIQAASQAYFGVPVSQLTLPQEALLAGLPQAPSAYDPLVHPQAALRRRNIVLELMAQQGYITANAAQAAEAAPLGLSPGTPGSGTSTGASGQYPYPWFVDSVISQLEQKYGLSAQQLATGGLRIYTTLDPKVYDAAQQAVTAQLDAQYPAGAGASNPMQAAAVIMNQQNGDVLAVIGGRSHTTELAFNRATQAEQQPGSAIKPLVDYIPALEAGYTAGTVVSDAVQVYNMGAGQPLYVPTNYDQLYYGLTTLTEALRRSVNTVAVKLLDKVGVAKGVATARSLGLTDLNAQANDHLSVALGGTVGCCTPLEMADAYATIANGGKLVTPRLLTKVVAPDGRVLVNDPVKAKRVLSPRIAYVMTKMLETVDTPQPNTGWDVLSGPLDSNWGTGYDAQVQNNVPGWPMAAKTGTTNGNRQAWYVGYTPLYTGAVWMGRDVPQTEPGMYGGTSAGPILQAAMEAALQGKTPVHFTRPAGIVEAPIDIMAPQWQVAKPGALTPPQYVRPEWFVAGTQPAQTSPLWVQAQVPELNNGALWQTGCPGGPPVIDTFLNLTGAYGPSWARGIASVLGTSNWQQFLPIDGSMAVPTQTCQPVTSPLAPFGINA